ncbi:MAG: hypothetical protein HRF46_11305 [Acidobacteriota bacterium]|jgi:hypothetical protein
MIALLLALAAAAPPTYLVERVTSDDRGSLRLTVFRDRMAVLARRAGPADPQVTRVRLDELEYRVVAQVVEECYGELARSGQAEGVLGGAITEVRLAPADKPPIAVKLSSTSARLLAAARLERALDELQRRIEQTPVGAEDLSDWEPRVGERVQLADGREGKVAALLPASVGVLVQLDIGPVSEYFPLDELRRKAVKRIDP